MTTKQQDYVRFLLRNWNARPQLCARLCHDMPLAPLKRRAGSDVMFG